MYIINDKNVEMIKRLCGLEMACRAIPDITIDLSNRVIFELIENDELSKETALASTKMGVSELGEIESLSLLERYASLNNPDYASIWYARRNDWGKLLYSTPNNAEILQRILHHLPQETINEHVFSTSRYLAAKVMYLHLALDSTVAEEDDIPEPVLTVSDPALSMWRHLVRKEDLDVLHEKTQWSIFDRASNNCICPNSNTSDTRIMLRANTKPLPVLISRGYWDDSNIDDILRKVEMSEHAESMMLILYERVCRLWGKNTELATRIKSKLRYTKILTPEGLLKFFTVEWFPSVPAIHHYILNADGLELERLIDTNYRAGIGIYDIVGITTPTALRKICVAALNWMMTNQSDEAQSIRNILNIIAHFTSRVPWDMDHARVCDDALKYTYTKELKIQFILMSSYPQEYKENISKP